MNLLLIGNVGQLYNIVKQLYTRFRNLILYSIIGAMSAGSDFLVFTILIERISIYYLSANIVSTLCGIVMSFTLNRHYNFKVKDNVLFRFVIFLSVGLSGLALSSVILYTMIDIWLQNELLSKFVALIVSVLVQFTLNKCITFREKNRVT